jgi:hypothetical protein
MNETKMCVICEHPTIRMACSKCQKRMNQRLNDILEFKQIVEKELLPGKGGDGRSSEKSIGLRVNALDFAAGLTVIDVLELWELEWRNHFNLTPYGPASLKRNQGKDKSDALTTGIIGFLQSWLDAACDKHPAINDFHNELDTCWRIARTAANQQPRVAWRVTCPTDTETGECGNILRVSGEDFDDTVTCHKCQTIWPTLRLLMVVASSNKAVMWVDKAAISSVIGFDERTIKRWAQEGKVDRRNGLYNFQDVLNIAMSSI